MALIKCSECGKEISDQATVCVHCGCPIEKKKYCPECGKPMAASLKACPECGCPVAPLPEVKKESPVDATSSSEVPKMNGLSLAGGITGICSIFIDILGLVAITAIILSCVGLSEVTNKGQRGKAWAITGIVLGCIELLYKFFQLINYGSFIIS